MTDENPYLSTVQDMYSDPANQPPSPETALRQSVYDGMQQDPDQAAKALPLAEANQIPLDMAKRNIQQLGTRENFDQIDFQGMLRDYPKLSTFLTNPDNAAVSHDDIPALQKVSDFARAVVDDHYSLSNIGNGLRNVLGGAISGFAGSTMTGAGGIANRIAQRTYDFSNTGQNLDPLDRFLLKGVAGTAGAVGTLMSTAGQNFKTLGNEIDTGDQDFGAQIERGLGMVVGQMAATLATGGAVTPFMVSQGADQGFEAAKAAGLQNTTQGDIAAGLDAAIMGVAGKIGLQNVMEGLPAAWRTVVSNNVAGVMARAGMNPAGALASITGRAIDIGYRGIADSVAMMGQTLATNAVNKVALGDEKDLTAGVADQGEVMGTVGLLSGAIMNALFHTNVHFNEATNQYRAQQMAAGRQVVQESKTFGRAPDKINELLRTETADRDVWINPGAVNTFYQRMSPDDRAALEKNIPDFGQKLSDSLKTGEDMQINQADYHTYVQPVAGSEPLDNWVKFEPEQVSEGERKQYQEFLDNLSGAADRDQEEAVGDTGVGDRIYQQLIQRYGQRQAPSGMPDVARLLSENPAKFYEHMNATYGHLPGAKEVLDRYVGNMQIAREYPELAAQWRKTPDFDAFIDRVRNGIKKTAKDNEKPALTGAAGRRSRAQLGRKARPPVMDYLARHADITEGSPVANELSALGITKKSHPFLFKKGDGGPSMFEGGAERGGKRGIDNIPVEEFNDYGQEYGLTAPDDGQGYVDTGWIMDQLSKEAAGEGAEDTDVAARRAAENDLMNILDHEGIDLQKATNNQVKEALQRFSDRQRAEGTTFAQREERAPEPFEREAAEVGRAKQDGRRFSKQIMDFLAGKIERGKMLLLGETPGVLKAVGAGDRPVVMSQRVMSKILNEKEGRITPVMLDQVVEKMADPVMVFGSKTAPGKSLVVMLDMKDAKGKAVNVIVGLEHAQGRMLVNSVESVYGRENDRFPVDEAKAGRLLYANKEKALNWERSAGQQLPKEIHQSEHKNIVFGKIGDVKGDEMTLKQGPSGSVTFRPDAPTLMRLFEGENLSTVLHELGHVYWHALQEMAVLPDAPEQLGRDVEAVKNWLREDTSYVHRYITKNNPYEVRQTDEGYQVLFHGEEVEKAKTEHEAAAKSQALYSDLLTQYDAGGGEKLLEKQNYGAPADSDLERHIQTGLEEKAADGFLDYLRNGEAPSADMKSAFQRFKAWLSMIYKGVRNTLPKISPEVKDVFDRMFATNEEIEKLRDNPEFSPEPQILAMLNKDERQKYINKYQKMVGEASDRLFRAAMRQSEARNTETYKESRASIRRDMQARADAERRYRAADQIVRDGGMNRKKLVDEYGKEILPYLSGHGGLVADKGGADPAFIAGIVGYDTSREMITDFMNMPKKKAYVDQLTDDEMVARHGDMLRDGTIEREAVEQFHNNMRAEILGWEMHHYARLAKMPAPSPEAIKIKAVNILGDRVMREIIPQRFYRAEVRAAQDVGKALGQGRTQDYAAAAVAKGKQLLNHHLYRMSLDARDEMDKNISKWGKLLRRKDKDLRDKMDIDFAYAARSVLSRHGFGVSMGNDDFATWYSRLQTENPELAGDIATAMDNATMENPKPFKDMTWNEFQGLSDAVNSLIQVGRDAREITVQGRKVAKDLAIQELTDQAANQKSSGISTGFAGKLTPADERKITVSGFKAMLRRVESWVDMMDEGKFNGVFRKYVWNGVREGIDSYRDERSQWMNRLYEMIAPHRERLMGEKIPAPELVAESTGETYTFENKGELVGMLAHLGNGYEPGSNGYKLLRGYGWDFDAFNSFLDRMHREGTLRKEDYDLVQRMWDMAEELKPQVWRAHKEMKGFYPAEVTRVPFQTPFGEYKGGYWPAIEDRTKSKAAENREAKNAITTQNDYAFPTTGSGATKERSANYAGPLEMNLNLLPRHLDWALRFVHIEPRVKDVAKLILDQKFRAEVDRIDPSVVDKMLVPWLQRAARQTLDLRKGDSFYVTNKLALWLRKNSQLQSLGLNIIYPLQRIGAISPMIYRSGAGNVAEAFMEYFGDIKGVQDTINQQSSFMRNRKTFGDQDYLTKVQRLFEDRSTRQKIGDWSQDHGFVVQRITHNFLDDLQWLSAYKQALAGDAQGVDPENKDQATMYADAEVRRTQGSFHAEDVSAAETGGPWAKLFTVFYGIMNTQANMIANEARTIMNSRGSTGAKAKSALYLYAMTYMIPSFLADVIYSAVRGQLPKDDNHDGHLYDDWFRFFIGSQIKYGMGMVPIVRDIGTAIEQHYFDKKFDASISFSPAEGLLQTMLLDTPTSLYNAVVHGKDPGRAVGDLLTSVGAAAQIPTGGVVRKSAMYLTDVAAGKEKPRGTLDVAKGVLTGPTPKK